MSAYITIFPSRREVTRPAILRTRRVFHRLLDGLVIGDADVFAKRLREWEHFYNYARPHGGLGGQMLYERLRPRTASDVTRLNSVQQNGHRYRGRLKRAP